MFYKPSFGTQKLLWVFWQSELAEMIETLKLFKNAHTTYNESTLFFAIFPFNPPENIRKLKGFQGDQKGTLGRKGLIYNNRISDL